MGDIIEIVGIIPFSLKRRFPGPISIPVFFHCSSIYFNCLFPTGVL